VTRLAAFPSLRPRDPEQAHRVATPLELIFDLVFVVAVGRASLELHHALAERHFADGLVGYAVVFFAIYWAWLNFTWFASAYDSDDWLYRVLTFLQMGGVLVLTAGIHDVFSTEPDARLVIVGYVVMRLALVSQWLRAAASDSLRRRVTQAYAGGIVAVQVLWVLGLLLPDGAFLGVFVVLVAAEVAVPAVAERRGEPTPWHPHHIAERYGLFTLIVLGETILASANAVVEAVEEGHEVPALVLLSASGLVLVAGMWWIYFDRPQHHLLTSPRYAFAWGYGHYFVFGSAAAVSAGIELLIEVELGHSELSRTAAAAVVSVPVAVFVLFVWAFVLRRRRDRVLDAVLPVAVLLLGLAAFVPGTIVVVAVLIALVAGLVTVRGRPAPGRALNPGG
jgi:low temperature requirement protein LtrA